MQLIFYTLHKVIKLGNSKMATSTSMVKFHYFEYTLGGDIVSSTPNAQYHNLNRLPSDFAKALCQIGEDGEIITWIPSQLHEGMKTHGKPGELTALEIRVEKVLY